MSSFFIESNSYEPWRNLAAEKFLAGRMRPGDVLLFLWQNQKSVIIGRNQNAQMECNGKLLEKEGGYLARRTTGGGAVYQDLGNLCFTFAASADRYDFEKQIRVIARACEAFGINVSVSGRNDLITSDGYKISGSAFSKSASCRLHHGTLLVDVDLDLMERYLTPSLLKMKSKGVQSVRSRVCNLKTLRSELTVSTLAERIRQEYAKEYGETADLPASLLDSPEIDALRNTFASWEWIYGKSPRSEIVNRTRFNWGEIQIHIALNGMKIRDCQIYTDALNIDFPEKLSRSLCGKRLDLEDYFWPEDLTTEERTIFDSVLSWMRSW